MLLPDRTVESEQGHGTIFRPIVASFHLSMYISTPRDYLFFSEFTGLVHDGRFRGRSTAKPKGMKVRSFVQLILKRYPQAPRELHYLSQYRIFQLWNCLASPIICSHLSRRTPHMLAVTPCVSIASIVAEEDATCSDKSPFFPAESANLESPQIAEWS